MAIDFTVVTPTRPSSHLTSSSTTTLMDHAAAQKLRKSKEKCQVAGWHFMPFVADCYGALRCDARTFIGRFIHRYSDRFFPLNETEAGKAIWSAVSSAAISRAAFELGRLTAADRPFGMPVDVLDLQTSRMRRSTIARQQTSLDMGTDMGIDSHKPSPGTRADAEILFDLPLPCDNLLQPPTSMELDLPIRQQGQQMSTSSMSSTT